MTRFFSVAAGALALLASTAGAAGIKGDYVEARTADVFTGPCFSNAEVFITGHQAVLAWKVTEGTFDGVDLAGLSVAAAVRGTTTFSQDVPEAARAVLIVDEQADPSQRDALVKLAKTLAGARLAHVEAIEVAPLTVTVEDHHAAAEPAAGSRHHGMPVAPKALLWSPGLAEILTRPLDETDHFCGNEVVAYEPLSRGVEAQPAYTLENRFEGRGLDTTWNDHNSRSAFVGHFAY